MIKLNKLIYGIDYLEKSFELQRDNKKTIKNLCHGYILT